MSDARKILDDARATLKRLEGCKAEFAADQARRDSAFVPLERTPPQPIKKPEPQRLQHISDDAYTMAWDEWLNGHLANFAEVLGAEIGRSDREINARLEALEVLVGELRAEREVERAARDDKVLTIPNWRKRNAAA